MHARSSEAMTLARTDSVRYLRALLPTWRRMTRITRATSFSLLCLHSSGKLNSTPARTKWAKAMARLLLPSLAPVGARALSQLTMRPQEERLRVAQNTYRRSDHVTFFRARCARRAQ